MNTLFWLDNFGIRVQKRFMTVNPGFISSFLKNSFCTIFCYTICYWLYVSLVLFRSCAMWLVVLFPLTGSQPLFFNYLSNYKYVCAWLVSECIVSCLPTNPLAYYVAKYDGEWYCLFLNRLRNLFLKPLKDLKNIFTVDILLS
jgi:hypothetical protein